MALSRKKIACASAVILALAALLAWLLLVPRVALDRVNETLSARFPGASAEAIDVGFGQSELQEIRLPIGASSELRIERLVIDASAFALATRGASAAEALTLRGVTLTLSADDLLAWWSERGSSSGAGGSPSSSSPSSSAPSADIPSITVEDARLAFSDAQGLLFSSALRAAPHGSGLAIALSETSIGGAPGDRVTLEDAQLILEGDTLDTLQLKSVALIAPSLSVGQEPGLTMERLLAIWRALRPEGGANVAADVPDTDDARPSRLSDDASLRFERGSARNEGRELVSALTGELHLAGEEIISEGEGEVERGEIRWDLTLDPHALRASGELHLQALPFDLLAPFLPDVPWYRPENGRVDATLSTRNASASAVELEGEIAIRGLSLEHERLADRPVTGIAFAASGKATFTPLSGTLSFEDAELRVGRARAQVSGALTKTPERYALRLAGTIQETPCDELVSAIPADLLGVAQEFSWGGVMSASFSADIDSDHLDALSLEVDVRDRCRFLQAPAAADLRRFAAPFEHRVEELDGDVFETTTGPGTSTWASIHEISPHMIQAVIGHEDGGFFRHHGFALWAIRGALQRNLIEGRYVVGGSTISMQLAKNLFLHRRKTIARKVQEVLLTWWLESSLSKQEIMELYLNIIEYGPMIYGIESASEHYFAKPPRDLNPVEAAYLACILPNPSGMQASYEQGALTSSMRSRITRFLAHQHEHARLDDEAYQAALLTLEGFTFHAGGTRGPGAAGGLPWQLEELVLDDASFEADEEWERDALYDEGLEE